MSATLTANPPASIQAYAGSEDPLLFRRVRTWWLLLALFLIVQGNGLFTREHGAAHSVRQVRQTYESSKILLFLTCAMWTICAGLAVKSIRPTVRLMMNQKAVLAFSTLACLSTLWSQDPLVTFRKAMLLFFICAFAWFFATYYSPADQVRLLLATGVIVALASVAMALLLPQYGITPAGEWKGVLAHKNRFGLAIFFLFSGLPFRRISRGRRLTVTFQAILAIGLILLSQSRTSLLLAFLVIGVRAFGRFIASRRKEQIPFMLYAAVVGLPLTALLIAIGKTIILALLGKDSTLTGRTESWAILAPFALRHLWLGYGYQGFWTGAGDSLHAIVRKGSGLTGADNGYVDTTLQFGLLGLGMLLIVLLVSARDFLRLLRSSSVPLIAYWYVSLILANFTGSVTELLFLAPVGISTFIFVVACAGLRNQSHVNAPLS